MGRQNRQIRWLLTKVLWHYRGKMTVADGTNMVHRYILMIIIFCVIFSIPKHFKEHMVHVQKYSIIMVYVKIPKNLLPCVFVNLIQ